MTKTAKKPMPKKIKLRPIAPATSAPGSRGLGPYFGGVARSPALIPGSKEQ